jgi:lipopolysaccharide export system permease protein
LPRPRAAFILRAPVPRLDRHLLREILVPLGSAVGFVVLTVFLFQAQRLVGAALGLGLTAVDALVIFVSALPPFLVLAVPMAYLLAVMIALGRLAADRELVVLFACGASPWRLARVPLALGLGMTLLALPLAHFGEPLGQATLYTRLVDVGLRNISQAVHPGAFNEDFSSMAIYARERHEDGTLDGLLLFDERDARRSIMVLASHGALVPEGARGLVLGLEDGEIHLGRGLADSSTDTYERVRFERASLGIDVERDLVERTRFLSEISRMHSAQMLPAARQRGDSLWSRKVEKAYWRRYAFPLMCLVFGLVGAAIVLTGRADARARNAVLALAAVVGYYVLMRVGDLVAAQWAPGAALAAFGPDLVLALLGGLGLARAGRPK